MRITIFLLIITIILIFVVMKAKKKSPKIYGNHVEFINGNPNGIVLGGNMDRIEIYDNKIMGLKSWKVPKS